MKRSIYAYLAIILLFAWCHVAPAWAQLRVVNPTDYPASVAIGYQDATLRVWTTKGWFTVSAHDSTTVLATPLLGGAYYVRWRFAGCDEVREGDYSLSYHPQEAFTALNAASAAPVSLTKGLVKGGFYKMSIGTQTASSLRLTAYCTRQGNREGAWTLHLDRDHHETTQRADATYERRIRYSAGQPEGIVREYDTRSGQLCWEGKLLSENPDVRQGTCTSYDDTGRKREEGVYQQGVLVAGTQKKWKADGSPVNLKARRQTLQVLPIQQGHLFSYYNSGSSRAVVPVTLPANTVQWAYQFTASHDPANLQALKARLQLASQLTKLLDKTGTVAAAFQMLTQPTGTDVCNVFLFDRAEHADGFRAKADGWTYVRAGSRENLTSALVPLNGGGQMTYYLGLYNPSMMEGIDYALEVVAVTEEVAEE